MTAGKMSCEEALARLLDFVDRELSGDEHERLARHLDACRSCFSRMEFERRLKGRLSELAHEEAPARTRERIANLIKGF